MAKKQTFDTAFAELQKISKEIQEGQISIDMLIKSVTRAEELIQFCKEKLRNVEGELTSVFEKMDKDDKIVVLTGAGISAESGLKTFRDENGLWEGHDVSQVATPEAWQFNPELVLDFYNQRRQQLKSVNPNAAHLALTELESRYNTVIITQNVDDLHERAGSTNIIHLHGELKKARSSHDPNLIISWDKHITIVDKAPDGCPLRPHIVWFGEAVPKMDDAIEEMVDAKSVIIIGTSMQVYPAASLIAYTSPNSEVYYVDPRPHISYELSKRQNLQIISEKAAVAVPKLVQYLLDKK